MILTDKQINQFAEELYPSFLDDQDHLRAAFIGGMSKYRDLLKDKRPLEERKEEFRLSVLQFSIHYDAILLDKFYKYWSETNKHGKMKWELQATWSVRSRLATWFRQEKKFSIINNLNRKK